MARKKGSRHNKSKQSQSMTLNAAIGIVGVLLLGFIYSFSRNITHTGVPIEVIFPKIETKILAVDVYQENPIQDIKVEVLNGCGIKGIAARAADFLRTNHVDVVRSDNADHHNYPNTVIISRNENVESLKAVSKSFGITMNDEKRILIVPDESLGVDVTVIIGKDIRDFTDLASFFTSEQ
ncbi:MAG: LytR C-terminal domain-containing protein [Fidelibacterota bacterium]